MDYPFTPIDKKTTQKTLTHHLRQKTNLTPKEVHEYLHSTPYQHSTKPPAPSTPEKDTLS